MQNNTPHLFKKRLPLIAILLLFIILKTPHLFYSFYWDESWPYASGVMRMFINGPGLLPGAIDGEIARGHPLMFHFLGAIWLKIFGTSHVAFHSFAIFISILFLISIYEVGLKFFGQRVAITALILIAFQQIFFVQSSMVLLEILAAFLGFLSIYCYSIRKYFLTAITLTMLFYTKESGLIVGFVLGIDAVISFFQKQHTAKEKLLKIFSVGIPVFMIGIFFLLQKKINGWYVLPLYSKGITEDWAYFYERYREAFKVIFRDDNRKYFFLLLGFLSVFTAWRLKKWKYASIAGASFFILLLIHDKYQYLLPEKIIGVVSSIAFILFIWLAAKTTNHFKNQQQKFIVLLSAFIICFSIFTALNAFFIVRYLLIALIPALFLAAVFFDFYIQSVGKWLFLPGLLFIIGMEVWAFSKSKGHSDIELGAFNGIYVHQKIADFLLQKNYQDKTIGSDAYLERIHLTDPYAGYIPNPADTFKNVSWEINDSTEIVIFDNIEPDDMYIPIKSDTNYSLIFRAERGSVWGEIYERRKAGERL